MAGKKSMEALSLRKKHYNCAQAVALPFCEELGLDREDVKKMMEGFGGGMGGYKLTCGALSAAVFIAGLKCGGDYDDIKSKLATYKICSEICDIFEKECGSCSCHDIRGISTGKSLKSCDECVLLGVDLAEKIPNINKQPLSK